MKDESAKSDSRMPCFERTLTELFGRGAFPLSLVGDLDDLLFTLDEAVGLLRSLSASESEIEFGKLRSSFSTLEIMLDHDLPMVS